MSKSKRRRNLGNNWKQRILAEENVGEALVVDVDINVNIAGPSWTAWRSIWNDAHHSNPLCRVTALELVRQEEELNYDKEKYREMLLEAAEAVLCYFGFDRTVYGAQAQFA